MRDIWNQNYHNNCNIKKITNNATFSVLLGNFNTFHLSDHPLVLAISPLQVETLSTETRVSPPGDSSIRLKILCKLIYLVKCDIPGTHTGTWC